MEISTETYALYVRVSMYVYVQVHLFIPYPKAKCNTSGCQIVHGVCAKKCRAKDHRMATHRYTGCMCLHSIYIYMYIHNKI